MKRETFENAEKLVRKLKLVTYAIHSLENQACIYIGCDNMDADMDIYQELEKSLTTTLQKLKQEIEQEFENI